MQSRQVLLNAPRAAGFSVLELLVTLAISALIFGLITRLILFQSDTYVEDIARLRIQQNLRGALDIVSMNVRQAGEGLDEFFPAFTLSQHDSPETSLVTIRRKTVSEVFTACYPIASGATQIFVSDIASEDSECFPTNVAASISAWSDYRTNHDGPVRIYLYDRVAKTGEFVEYTGEGQNATDYFLSTSATSSPYPIRSTSIYILEQFVFSLEQASSTLQLAQDGITDEPHDVAYRVSDFQVRLTMEDGSTLSTISPTSTLNWKDIRAVSIAITGQESWKTRTFVRTVNGSFFPRNVLSH